MSLKWKYQMAEHKLIAHFFHLVWISLHLRSDGLCQAVLIVQVKQIFISRGKYRGFMKSKDKMTKFWQKENNYRNEHNHWRHNASYISEHNQKQFPVCNGTSVAQPSRYFYLCFFPSILHKTKHSFPFTKGNVYLCNCHALPHSLQGMFF